MYKCIRLNKINIKYLKKLNARRYIFNTLNENFFDVYDTSNFAQQILLRRRVYLLAYNSKYIGYIWFTPDNKYDYTINALNVVYYNDIDLYKCCSLLLNSLKNNINITFKCNKNQFNFNILNQLDFKKNSGIIQLSSNLNDNYDLKLSKEIEFSPLKLGKEESIRCYIQNNVFKSPNRIPLTIQDIYYDENQSYYIDQGAVLVKKNDRYIGYGQIILQNNTPLIVNVGILEPYRGRGYGKELLIYLLNTLKMNKFEKVYIKVDMNNDIALKLYQDLGFKVDSEICIWKKTIL